METGNLIEYGSAKKNWWEFTEEDVLEANEKIYKRVRDRAWAFGLPVYYMIGDITVAEYANGRKMVVETINGERIETREYCE